MHLNFKRRVILTVGMAMIGLNAVCPPRQSVPEGTGVEAGCIFSSDFYKTNIQEARAGSPYNFQPAVVNITLLGAETLAIIAFTGAAVLVAGFFSPPESGR